MTYYINLLIIIFHQFTKEMFRIVIGEKSPKSVAKIIPSKKYVNIVGIQKNLSRYSNKDFNIISDKDYDDYERKIASKQGVTIEPPLKYGSKLISDLAPVSTNLILNTGSIVPVIRPGREVLYIVGASGAGKSYYAMMYLKQYHKQYPSRKIYLFTDCKQDPLFDDSDLPITRVALDDTYLESIEDGEAFIADDFEDSIVLFDDTDTIKNKTINKHVYELMRQIMETGRKTNVTCIITSHTMSNRERTRLQLSESTSVTFFPSNHFDEHIRYYLSHKMFLNKITIDRIMNLPSSRGARWVTCVSGRPSYIFYSGGLFII